jgi:hypothetical protein
MAIKKRKRYEIHKTRVRLRGLKHGIIFSQFIVALQINSATHKALIGSEWMRAEGCNPDLTGGCTWEVYIDRDDPKHVKGDVFRDSLGVIQSFDMPERVRGETQ